MPVSPQKRRNLDLRFKSIGFRGGAAPCALIPFRLMIESPLSVANVVHMILATPISQ